MTGSGFFICFYLWFSVPPDQNTPTHKPVGQRLQTISLFLGTWPRYFLISFSG